MDLLNHSSTFDLAFIDVGIFGMKGMFGTGFIKDEFECGRHVIQFLIRQFSWINGRGGPLVQTPNFRPNKCWV